MTRDPLLFVRFDSSADDPLSLSLRPVLGPPLAGTKLESQVGVCPPGGPGLTAPFALTRNFEPWVLIRVEEVADVRNHISEGTGWPAEVLRAPSVEAAFTVIVDFTARWRSFSLEQLPD